MHVKGETSKAKTMYFFVSTYVRRRIWKDSNKNDCLKHNKHLNWNVWETWKRTTTTAAQRDRHGWKIRKRTHTNMNMYRICIPTVHQFHFIFEEKRKILAPFNSLTHRMHASHVYWGVQHLTYDWYFMLLQHDQIDMKSTSRSQYAVHQTPITPINNNKN